ncbi:hypothetical protein E5288_WYG017853 [Bos mutus]|uniref:Uncharacterized protein n=1 Tax=Bos mutus TaxID=72004 RepID=A0A6B0S5X8_9CETA|nr:hypothetical protein [Bos mutus]
MLFYGLEEIFGKLELESFQEDGLQAFTNRTIQELLLTHSDYQKLRLHTNPLDPHSSLLLSHPHNTLVLQEEVTED